MSSLTTSLTSFTNSLPKEKRQTAIELSKKMSQVVAKSWLPNTEGERIRTEIMSRDSKRIKKVFQENGCDFSFYEGYSFELNVDSFEGNIKELDKIIMVAYPPRPSNFNLSDADLNNWIENDNPNQTDPSHPYIPVTF